MHYISEQTYNSTSTHCYNKVSVFTVWEQITHCKYKGRSQAKSSKCLRKLGHARELGGGNILWVTQKVEAQCNYNTSIYERYDND